MFGANELFCPEAWNMMTSSTMQKTKPLQAVTRRFPEPSEKPAQEVSETENLEVNLRVSHRENRESRIVQILAYKLKPLNIIFQPLKSMKYIRLHYISYLADGLI